MVPDDTVRLSAYDVSGSMHMILSAVLVTMPVAKASQILEACRSTNPLSVQIHLYHVVLLTSRLFVVCSTRS